MAVRSERESGGDAGGRVSPLHLFDAFVDELRAFRRTLRETGFVGDDNVAIAFRTADNDPERLPALAAELVRRRVNVIVAITPVATAAAKGATRHPGAVRHQ